MSRGPTCSASWSTKSSPFQGIADMIESPLDQTSPPAGATPPAGLREMGKKKTRRSGKRTRQSIRFWECLWVQRQRWAPKMGSNGRCIAQYDCHPTLHPCGSTILLCYPAPGSPSQWKREGFICEAATSVTGRWLVGCEWCRRMEEI